MDAVRRVRQGRDRDRRGPWLGATNMATDRGRSSRTVVGDGAAVDRLRARRRRGNRLSAHGRGGPHARRSRARDARETLAAIAHGGPHVHLADEGHPRGDHA